MPANVARRLGKTMSAVDIANAADVAFSWVSEIIRKRAESNISIADRNSDLSKTVKTTRGMRPRRNCSTSNNTGATGRPGKGTKLVPLRKSGTDRQAARASLAGARSRRGRPSADFGLGVLQRVLSFAVDTLGRLSGNPCRGLKNLYRVDRSEIIWTAADIEKLKRTCLPEVADATDLAAHTGLRLGDLVRLSWSHIGEDEIVIATGKSRGRCSARIPIYDDLRAVLARIPKRSTTVLTHKWGRPWAAKSLGNAFTQAKNAAGFADLHFHDLRGSAATKFYVAGLSESLVAEIMGWETEHVAKIIRRYVDRGAVIKAAIAQLNKRGT